MSNLGLHRAMAEHGIRVETTAVGDRYVLERMNEGGFSLGGEQSGHVIMSRFATDRRRRAHRAAPVRRDGAHRQERWPSWPPS
jgi:phosphomannomutase